MSRSIAASVLMTLALVGCDSFQPTVSNDGANCQPGDTAVASSQMCLMDDAACYQLDNGQWCTGPRAGSSG